MSTHQVGEAVLVLDPATLTRISSLDEVSLARIYRAVSIGSDPSLPAAVGFTNEAASLKPYAPVQVQGARNGGGDLTIIWIRRTRYSGEWRDLVDVPLNEASEAYEVDVLDGAGQVLRTAQQHQPIRHLRQPPIRPPTSSRRRARSTLRSINSAQRSGGASPGELLYERHPEPGHRAHPPEPGAEGGHRQRGVRSSSTRRSPGCSSSTSRPAARSQSIPPRRSHARCCA